MEEIFNHGSKCEVLNLTNECTYCYFFDICCDVYILTDLELKRFELEEIDEMKKYEMGIKTNQSHIEIEIEWVRKFAKQFKIEWVKKNILEI